MLLNQAISSSFSKWLVLSFWVKSTYFQARTKIPKKLLGLGEAVRSTARGNITAVILLFNKMVRVSYCSRQSDTRRLTVMPWCKQYSHNSPLLDVYRRADWKETTCMSVKLSSTDICTA